MNKFLVLIFMCLGLSSLLAQTVQVSGTVTSADDGQSLPGVSVVVKGTTGQGTVTNSNGQYSLSVPADAVLQFTFVGMSPQDIAVAGRQIIDVVMAPSAMEIDEVVVTAYGTIKKSTFTGAVSTVTAEKLEHKPVATFVQALQGNVAGVVSTSGSGQPGADSKVVIRGRGSITAGTDPLYVIDGVPITIGDWSTTSGSSTWSNPNSLSSLVNPNDIESIVVLKDAAATSIYGSRAANGVILITTKKGKLGKPQFTLNVQGGVGSRTKKFDLLNTEQYIELNTEAMKNSGYSDAEIQKVFDRFPKDVDDNYYDTNWLDDYAYRNNAAVRMIDLSVNGGTESTKYFLSMSNYYQDAILRWGSIDRKSARLNLTHQSSDWINFGMNGFYSIINQTTPLTTSSYYINPAAGGITLPPMEFPYNLDGTYRHIMNGNNGTNFVEAQDLNTYDTRVDRILGNTFAEIKFLKDFRFKTSWGIDYFFMNDHRVDDMRTTGSSAEDLGRVDKAYQNVRKWITTNTLSYRKTFDEHNVNLVLGQEAENFDYDIIQAVSEGFASYKLRQVSSGATPVETYGYLSSYRLASYLFNGNYDFRNKYFLSASFRYDGSSKFSADNKWASFWSIGGAWEIGKENFMSNAVFIDMLKLRTSYGTSGNSDIGYYTSFGLYSFGAYNGGSASWVSQPNNPELKWESQALFNIGVDFQMFDRRLGGTVEWYNRVTDDLLLNVPLSAPTGFTTQLRNVGSIKNTGLELTLNAEPVRTNDLTWRIEANWSMNKNKTLKLYEGIEYVDQGRKRIREGEDMNQFWLVRFAGVNPANGAETWYDSDGNQVFQRDPDTQRVNGIGAATPKWQAGLTNYLSAYGFDLSVFFFFNYGNMIFDNIAYQYQHDGSKSNTNELTSMMNRWQKPGDVSPNPKRHLGANTEVSTRFLYDGSYVRLRNITLGYHLPKKFVESIYLSNLRIFAQGHNLLTFTNYPGQDPEFNYNGENFYQYPAAKAILAGIEIKF